MEPEIDRERLLDDGLGWIFIAVLLVAPLAWLVGLVTGAYDIGDGYFVAGFLLVLLYVLMDSSENDRVVGALLAVVGGIAFWLGAAGHLRSGTIYLGLFAIGYGVAILVKPDLLDRSH
ncbi:hypothetical protein RBH26_06960 [Natronolimnohabitans sp. A-GB9]|uniref:hypothetical protein n=1 Tax=Natronolimnohabitans sp. A-GB9 TaxID=3069757 RepID=UPI000738C180|nr:hypothetical protein [Natronolimnohabitans sp. A-GB9]MDQ2050221.1 hypothetical protein [Natronolimnohabitans sp. A-GB9]